MLKDMEPTKMRKTLPCTSLHSVQLVLHSTPCRHSVAHLTHVPRGRRVSRRDLSLYFVHWLTAWGA